VLALLRVQAGGRGQPMHAEISDDDTACMPDCGAQPIEPEFCGGVGPNEAETG
jgi:hypothetical protein